MFAELRRAERGAGESVASAGPEEETAEQPAASAGVHHLVPAQGRQHGEQLCIIMHLNQIGP